MKEKFNEASQRINQTFFYPRLKSSRACQPWCKQLLTFQTYPNAHPSLHSRQDKWLLINSFAKDGRRQNEAISRLEGCVCVGKAAIDMHIRDHGVASVINGCIVHSKLSLRRRRRCTVAERAISATDVRKKVQKLI